MQLTDRTQRIEALNIHNSYLIQAPAGSGKTGLLIQRYLKLLSEAVVFPEEIIAITFTRKAAGEMKQRILEALKQASFPNYVPESEHDKQTYDLAKKALNRSINSNWQILENTNRLKILTIDAFCARLTKQMPVLSQFGAQPTISDNVNELFVQSSELILQTLEEDVPWSEALETLLIYLDNDHSKVQRLFVSMLSNRDQWMPYIINANPREELENSLRHIIESHMYKLEASINCIDHQALLKHIKYAAKNLLLEDPLHPLSKFSEIQSLFPFQADYLSEWQTVAGLFLTNCGEWRSRLDKKIGFPSPSNQECKELKVQFKQAKDSMAKFIDGLRENSQIHEILSSLTQLPNLHYTEEQWSILQALITILPILVAQLHILFKQTATVDHTEIALKAIEALGTPDDPTDLTLALDYKIKHILVDEYQDTSINQFKLLKMITLGWEINDGRTLFLVGDPMQSIYRFRKAEVGLFLQTRDHGINSIYLHFLQLTTNFRSTPTIVEWNNQTYEKIFPKQDDLSLSAITYATSTSSINNCEPSKVSLHPILSENFSDEAEEIIAIIKTSYTNNPNQKIAILVQSRSHLKQILPKLRINQILYHAVELDNLYDKPLIQDLLALTIALSDLSNTISWYSILRAPWCGIELADLVKLKNSCGNKILFERLLSYHDLPVSEHANKQLARIMPILFNAWFHLYDHSLCNLIEATWMALGGPACLKSSSDESDANKFFECLAEFELTKNRKDLHVFQEMLRSITADSKPSACNFVEVMTIHKSKGLEFDTVILPGLDRPTRSDDRQLLLWQEIPTEKNKMELLLVPIKSSKKEPIYDYIRALENKKTVNELYRLLYVATTRAKKNLHLLFTLEKNEKKTYSIIKPRAGSLLYQLWPAIENEIIVNPNSLPKKTLQNELNVKLPHMFSRLKQTWQSPFPYKIQLKDYQTVKSFNNNRRHARWTFESERILGVILHKILEGINYSTLNTWEEKTENEKIQFIQKIIHLNNVPIFFQTEFIKNITSAINNMLADNFGRWILSSESKIEYKIHSNSKNTEIETHIIDRVIETENYIWIIDFKTTLPKEMIRQVFLSQQAKKYLSQLDTYTNLLKQITRKPIKRILYFPLLPDYIEV